MFPAARVTDLHICPMVPTGAPVLAPGEPTVIIGFLPAARAGDKAACAGPPDVILRGEPTVLIGHLPAARMGDPTTNGGAITLGCPSVLIGSTPQARVLTAASARGAPFCRECDEAPPAGEGDSK